MKTKHYPHGHALYHALSRLLDPDVYDIVQRDRHEPAEYGEKLDRETRAVLADFIDWLGQTTGGRGLTSEPTADWYAREKLRVRVTTDRNNAVVIRVPR
jgi:hypothetical protein